MREKGCESKGGSGNESETEETGRVRNKEKKSSHADIFTYILFFDGTLLVLLSHKLRFHNLSVYSPSYQAFLEKGMQDNIHKEDLFSDSGACGGVGVL